MEEKLYKIKKGKELKFYSTEPSITINKINGDMNPYSRRGINKFDINKLNKISEVVKKNNTTFNLVNCWAKQIINSENLSKMFEPNTKYVISSKVKLISKPTNIGTGTHEYLLMLYKLIEPIISISVLQCKNISEKLNWNVGETKEIIQEFITPSNFTDFQLLAYNYLDADKVKNGEFEYKDLMIRKANLMLVPNELTVTTVYYIKVKLKPDTYTFSFSEATTNLTDKVSFIRFIKENVDKNTKLIDTSIIKSFDITLNDNIDMIAVYSSTNYNTSLNQTKIFKNLSIEYKNLNSEKYEEYGAIPSIEFPSFENAIGSNINFFNISKVNDYLDIIKKINNGFRITKTSNGNVSEAYELFLEPNVDYVICYEIIDKDVYNQSLFCKWNYEDGTSVYSPNLLLTSNVIYAKFTKKVINVQFFIQNTEENGKYIEIKNIKVEKGKIPSKYSDYNTGNISLITTNKNLLKYTSPIKQTVFNGVEIKIFDDGKISLNGTSTLDMYPDLFWGINTNTRLSNINRYYFPKTLNNIILSTKIVSGTASSITMNASFNGEEEIQIHYPMNEIDSSKIVNSNIYNINRIWIYIPKSAIFNNFEFYAQLEEGTEKTIIEQNKEYTQVIQLPEKSELFNLQNNIIDNINSRGEINKKAIKFYIGRQKWNVFQSTANSNMYYCYTDELDNLIKKYTNANIYNYSNIAYSIPEILTSTMLDRDSLCISQIGQQRTRFMLNKYFIDSQIGANLSEKLSNLFINNKSFIIAESINENSLRNKYFNGSENWEFVSTGNNTSYFKLSNYVNNAIDNIYDNINKNKDNLLCNILPIVKDDTNIAWSTDVEGICIDNNKVIHVRILKSIASDLEKFKNYINKNNIEIVYSCKPENYNLKLLESELNKMSNMPVIIGDNNFNSFPVLTDTTILYYDERTEDELIKPITITNNGKLLPFNLTIDYNKTSLPLMAEAIEATQTITGANGDLVLDTTYGSRLFEITALTEDFLSPEEKEKKREEIRKYMNSIKKIDTKLIIEPLNRTFEVKYAGLAEANNLPKCIEFILPFKSSSSYSISNKLYSKIGEGDIISETQEPTGFIMTLEGPCVLPEISLNGYLMSYENNILIGQKLIIDTKKSTVTHITSSGIKTNAMPYYNHQFPKIQNGINILSIISGIENNKLKIEWNDLFL